MKAEPAAMLLNSQEAKLFEQVIRRRAAAVRRLLLRC
jgi:hypothetical protein